MKSLIALLAIVAFTAADVCQDEAKATGKCVGDTVKAEFAKFGPTLKAFGEEIKKCFNNDCQEPEKGAPPPQAEHPAFNFSSDFKECGQDVKANFLKCFPIPANAAPPHPQNGAPGPQGGPGGPPGGAPFHPFHPDPRQIGAMVLKVCKGNKVAAQAFFKCGLEAANKTRAWQALGAISEPVLLLCRAQQNCSSISDSCKAEFQKKQQEFCGCRNSTVEFAKQDASCQKARAELKAKFEAAIAKYQKDHPEAAAAPHAGQVHPQFDLCAENPCAAYEERLKKFAQTMHAAHASGAATHAA